MGIKSTFKGLWSDLKTDLKKAYNYVTTPIKKVVSPVVDKVQDLTEQAKEAVGIPTEASIAREEAKIADARSYEKSLEDERRSYDEKQRMAEVERLESREDSAYQRAVDDWQKAGLNINAFSGSGSGSGSVAYVSGEKPHFINSLGEDEQNILKSLMPFIMLMAKFKGK